MEAERRVRERAVAEAEATRAKFEGLRSAEAKRLAEWESALRYYCVLLRLP